MSWNTKIRLDEELPWMVRQASSGLLALVKGTWLVGTEKRAGGRRKVGWPLQTHQAPEEGEEPGEDEVYDKGQVNWASQDALSLFLLYLPHGRETG